MGSLKIVNVYLYQVSIAVIGFSWTANSIKVGNGWAPNIGKHVLNVFSYKSTAYASSNDGDLHDTSLVGVDGTHL